MNEEILNKCADNNNYTIYTAFLQSTAYYDAVIFARVQYQRRK